MSNAFDGAGAPDAPDVPDAGRAVVASRPMTRRRFIGRSAGVALAVGGSSAFLAACGGSGGDGDGGEVVVVGWDSYVRQEIVEGFERAYPGVKLRPVPAESDQDMFTKLKAGGGGQYDVVWANAGFVPLYAENDLIEPQPIAEQPVYRLIYDDFLNDPRYPWVVRANDEMWFAPNAWSSYAAVWNHGLLTPPQPPSWNMLWDRAIPENKVMMMGAPDDFLVVAGLALGVPQSEIYAMSGATLDRARDYLIDLKPFQLNTSVEPRFRRAVIDENVWAGLSPTVGLANRINAEAGRDIASLAVPEEGTIGWVDGPMIAKGAKNRENAQKYIDYIVRDAVGFLFEQYQTASCNREFVEATIARGGRDARTLLDLQANRPQIARQIEFQRPADDPQAWTAAWDEVQAA